MFPSFSPLTPATPPPSPQTDHHTIVCVHGSRIQVLWIISLWGELLGGLYDLCFSKRAQLGQRSLLIYSAGGICGSPYFLLVLKFLTYLNFCLVPWFLLFHQLSKAHYWGLCTFLDSSNTVTGPGNSGENPQTIWYWQRCAITMLRLNVKRSTELNTELLLEPCSLLWLWPYLFLVYFPRQGDKMQLNEDYNLMKLLILKRRKKSHTYKQLEKKNGSVPQDECRYSALFCFTND